MTDDFRIGVIGAGLMGRRYCACLGQMFGARLAGVAEVSAEARAAVAGRFGVPVFEHWRELLAGDLDAVVIALPDHLHRDAALAAIGSGRHVLIEKPLATDPDEAAEIAAAAAGSQRVIMAGHLLRFDPRYALAREAVRAGRLGEVVHLTARRNSAVAGPLRYGRGISLAYHVAVHDLDLIRWCTGQDIVRVAALARSVRLRELGAHDSLLALLTLSGGAMAALECAWILPAHLGSGLDARLTVVGTEGSVEVTGLDQGLIVHDAAGTRWPDTMRHTEIEGQTDGLLCRQTEAFVRAARRGGPAPVPLADALAAVQAAAAVERSIAAGGTSSIAPIFQRRDATGRRYDPQAR